MARTQADDEREFEILINQFSADLEVTKATVQELVLLIASVQPSPSATIAALHRAVLGNLSTLASHAQDAQDAERMQQFLIHRAQALFADLEATFPEAPDHSKGRTN